LTPWIRRDYIPKKEREKDHCESWKRDRKAEKHGERERQQKKVGSSLQLQSQLPREKGWRKLKLQTQNKPEWQTQLMDKPWLPI
jgi:hypothetical protein